MATDVFLSVGRAVTDKQREFINALIDRLHDEGISVRRAEFSAVQPLIKISEEMRKCSGAVVVAFERLFSEQAIEFRDSDQKNVVADLKLPTVWNQIEAAIAYTLGLPLFVICERGSRQDGLLENRYDWMVNCVEIEKAQLYRREFNEVLRDWKERVVSKSDALTSRGAKPDLSGLTIAELAGMLKADQFWKVAAAITTLVGSTAGAAFWLGLKLGK